MNSRGPVERAVYNDMRNLKNHHVARAEKLADENRAMRDRLEQIKAISQHGHRFAVCGVSASAYGPGTCTKADPCLACERIQRLLEHLHDVMTKDPTK